MLSHFSHVWLFVTRWTVARQAPLSMGFCRQEYWSGLPCPPPGDLLNPGMEPMSLMAPALADRFFTTSATWEALSPVYPPKQLWKPAEPQADARTLLNQTLKWFGLYNHCGWWLQSWNQKTIASWQENYGKPRRCVKKQRHHSADKGPYGQSDGFSSSHIQTWELDLKEGRALKNWCIWTLVLEKTLESPLDCKEIKPVNPKGKQPWILIGRTDAEAEAPILWPPDVKSWLIGKDTDVGKDWRQGEKGATEDEVIGWHHRLNGHELGQTPGNNEGQGGLACCSPWGRRVNMTEWLNWLTENTQW